MSGTHMLIQLEREKGLTVQATSRWPHLPAGQGQADEHVVGTVVGTAADVRWAQQLLRRLIGWCDPPAEHGNGAFAQTALLSFFCRLQRISPAGMHEVTGCMYVMDYLAAATGGAAGNKVGAQLPECVLHDARAPLVSSQAHQMG